MIDDILQSGFLTTFINLLLSAIQGLVKILLYPIDLVVNKLAPDVTLQPITDFFESIATFTGLILNQIWIPPSVISLAIGYLVFAITATAGAYAFKLGIKWYNALKP